MYCVHSICCIAKPLLAGPCAQIRFLFDTFDFDMLHCTMNRAACKIYLSCLAYILRYLSVTSMCQNLFYLEPLAANLCRNHSTSVCFFVEF